MPPQWLEGSVFRLLEDREAFDLRVFCLDHYFSPPGVVALVGTLFAKLQIKLGEGNRLIVFVFLGLAEEAEEWRALTMLVHTDVDDRLLGVQVDWAVTWNRNVLIGDHEINNLNLVAVLKSQNVKESRIIIRKISIHVEK